MRIPSRRKGRRRFANTVVALAVLGGFGGMASVIDSIGRLIEPWRSPRCTSSARSADESQGSGQFVHRRDWSGADAQARDRACGHDRMPRIPDQRVR